MLLIGLVFSSRYVHIMKPFLCVTQAIVIRNAKVKANTIPPDTCEKRNKERATF